MSLATRLYRGETDWDVIGRSRTWYVVSLALVSLSVLLMIVRGFNFGIEFDGGAAFQFPSGGGTIAQATETVEDLGVRVASVQEVGADQILVKTEALDESGIDRVESALVREFRLDEDEISPRQVSPSWGGQVTDKALQGLLLFLVAVVAYISVRFEPKMALAAIAALLHDLVITAGIYSLVGFEVTPSTIIALLTVLGFSLYDTVVVFDKVQENVRGLTSGSRQTYSEATNLALNQTFMRSLNTSLISLLPVAGLLFVGAGLLRVGTLKDLALALFVGLAVGAYSSLFLAPPVLASLKEREPQYQALRKRVLSRRTGAPVTGSGLAVGARTLVPVGAGSAPAGLERDDASVATPAAASGAASAVRRQQPARRKGSRPGRPSGKRKR